MHESPTSHNSPDKPYTIQITHKALSIFLLHVRHDKVSLSKQMTISHGFKIFKLVFKTEPDINYREPVTQHHQNDEFGQGWEI